MKASILLTGLILFINIHLSSQGNWQVVEIPEEFVGNSTSAIRILYHDTVENALWMGGYIPSTDSLPGSSYNFLLKYDGINWKHYGPFCGSPIFGICRFQDKIVFGGFILNYADYNCNPDEHRGIAYIQNDTVGHFEGMGTDGYSYGFEVIDNELYVFGTYDTICGFAANSVAKYNGSEWSTVYDFPEGSADFGNAQVYCGTKYNDQLYLGGLYGNEEYFGSTHTCISNYNGVTWELTGGGILGGLIGVSELKVYKNELYAAGIIFKDAGNEGNGIQKWNGFNWTPVGGDLKGYNNSLGSFFQVTGLDLHNNELYISGQFEYAGEISANRVVKWDGEKYCSFGGEFNAGLGGVAFMNDTMYVAGAFTTIDGIQTYQGRLAKYLGGNSVVECSIVGIKENDALLQLDIYPTPAVDEINIYLPKGDFQNLEVEVYNLLGQKVLIKNINTAENKKINIPIQNFSKGQYMVLLKEKGVAIGGGRFIKE